MLTTLLFEEWPQTPNTVVVLSKVHVSVKSVTAFVPLYAVTKGSNVVRVTLVTVTLLYQIYI